MKESLREKLQKPLDHYRVSESVLYLSNPHAPLPCYRMKEPHVTVTKAGKRQTITGKILVRRSDFDAWMQRFKYTPDLDRLVDEVVRVLRQ